MSKKSVSDIMKPVVIFPNDQSPYMTSRFEVRNHPIILRAFGIDCDTVGHIEMGYNDGCGGWFWGPYIPDCDQLALLGCANAIAIGLPGWYRIVFRDRITGEPSTGLDDLVVTITETDMPASMLAQFSGGSASMACGSQVSIREEDGCFYISVDNQAYTICPGDSVSCDPNGLGIVINGELCPFPAIPDVSVEVNEDGCLVIVVDGEATVFCPSPDSVTIIDALADDIYQATNPDGSVVQWNGANSITLVDEFDTGQFRATNPDGSTVDWDGNNSVTVVSDLGEGQFQAENPDGSLVTWDGENSVTIASVDTTEGTITITNPDGSTVTFQYLEEAPVQTEVSRGTGNVRQQQTITADHHGTYPNTTWRESYVVRNGDVANIHLWDPADNAWDVVSVYAPENIVILNNPTFYIRQATGSPNPPINDQSDLTVANAFDSFVSMFQFINRSNIIGNVTVDVRGNFDAGDRNMAWSPADFKNAVVVVLRGDPDDPTAFRLNIEDDTPSNVGPTASGGLNLTVRDMQIHHMNGHTNATGGQAFRASENSQLNLRGTILATGFIDMNRPGVGGTWFFVNAVGGSVSLGGFNQPESLTLNFNMDANTLFSNIIRSQQGGSVSINDVRGNIINDVGSAGPVVNVMPMSNIEFYGLPNNPGNGGIQLSGADFTGNYSLQLAVSSYMSIGANPSYGGGFDDALNALHAVGSTNMVRMDLYSNLVGQYGSQLDTNPLVTLF